jgi:hypothetical protein
MGARDFLSSRKIIFVIFFSLILRESIWAVSLPEFCWLRPRYLYWFKNFIPLASLVSGFLKCFFHDSHDAAFFFCLVLGSASQILFRPFWLLCLGCLYVQLLSQYRQRRQRSFRDCSQEFFWFFLVFILDR